MTAGEQLLVFVATGSQASSVRVLKRSPPSMPAMVAGPFLLLLVPPAYPALIGAALPLRRRVYNNTIGLTCALLLYTCIPPPPPLPRFCGWFVEAALVASASCTLLSIQSVAFHLWCLISCWCPCHQRHRRHRALASKSLYGWAHQLSIQVGCVHCLHSEKP